MVCKGIHILSHSVQFLYFSCTNMGFKMELTCLLISLPLHSLFELWKESFFSFPSYRHGNYSIMFLFIKKKNPFYFFLFHLISNFSLEVLKTLCNPRSCNPLNFKYCWSVGPLDMHFMMRLEPS